MLDISSHDVLIVGGGGAGLRAAIAVAETNPNLNIAVLSKVYPMRSHTVSAEGGAAGVIGPDDTLDEHAYDTISGGDWLPDQDAVEFFVKEAPEELLRMEHWGCPWNREPNGRVAVRPFGGMKKERTWFAADKTGFHMLHTLFQTSLKYNAVTRYDEFYATKLLTDDGQVLGLLGQLPQIAAGGRGRAGRTRLGLGVLFFFDADDLSLGRRLGGVLFLLDALLLLTGSGAGLAGSLPPQIARRPQTKQNEPQHEHAKADAGD